MFGLNASPFLLSCTVIHHLSQWESKDPEFVRKMIEGLYVDDLVTGEDSVDSAFSVYDKAMRVMGQVGFKLRKWVTNDERLRESIEGSEKSLTVNIEEDEADDESCKVITGNPGYHVPSEGSWVAMGLQSRCLVSQLQGDLREGRRIEVHEEKSVELVRRVV